MNGKQLIKQLTVASVLAACVIGGTRLWGQATPPKESATPTPPAAVQPAPAPDTDEIATVNGKQMPVKEFNGVLMEVSGMRVFYEFMDFMLVKEACLEAGVQIDAASFNTLLEAERQHMLAQMGPPDLKPAEREQILGKLMQDKGVTHDEFVMSLQEQAGLRLLSKGKVAAPTDKEIESYFTAHYGQIARMVVLNVKDIKETEAVREALKKNPDIRAVATAMKLQASELKIPSNSEDPKPYSIFKDLAFGTPKTAGMKANELSETIPFTPPAPGSKEIYYVVYFEEMIPKQNVLLTDPKVHDQVVKDVQELNEQNWMNNHMQVLRATATIVVQNKFLKPQTDYIMKQIEAQKAALATQPAAPAAPVAPVTSAPAATAPAK